MFTVTCLGRNGLYPTLNNPTSGYLVVCGDKKILLDIGSGVFAKLLAVTDPGSVDAVVVSHFHGDHCSDLTVYDYYLSHTGKKIDLYAPDGDGAFIRKHNNFIHKVTYDGYFVHIGEATVWFFKTCHPAYCLGVRVEFGGKVFVYSADTSECENLDKALEGADLSVLDCAFQKEQYRVGGPHLSADICGNYAKKYNVKTLLSHLPPEGDTQTLLRQAKECSALCELIDFKTYTV